MRPIPPASGDDDVRAAAFIRGESFTIRGGAADTGVMASVVRSGEFEPHLVEFFGRAVPEGGTVIDIGANIGVHTLALSRIVGGGRVVAVEPAPANLRHLEWNIAANDCSNVTVAAVGLSDEPGQAELNFSSTHPGGAFLADTDVHDQEAFHIELSTLDAIADELGIDQLDLVKIDVEGSEPQVLEGGRRVLTTHRPVVIMEANPIPLARFRGAAVSELVAAASTFGPLSVLQPDGSTQPIYAPIQLDYLATRRGIVDLVVNAPGRRRLLPAIFWRGTEALKAGLGFRIAQRLRPGAFVTRAGGSIEVSVRRMPAEGSARVVLGISVKNGCNVALRPDGEHPVRVGIRPERGVEQRAELPLVPQGGSVEVEAMVELDDLDPQQLRVALVQEGWAWLDDLEPDLGSVVTVGFES